jgi:hypothetical protein
MASAAFSGIPSSLRTDLLKAFSEIVRNFRERRWEPSELNGGKLCEVVYSILEGYINGKFPTKATKPKNMVDACRALEKADSSLFSRSIRIQIPRMLITLYEVRNNRGVGHVGGDVDPNHMDARVVLELSKWIMAELVRVFHNLKPDDATQFVERLVDRTLLVVWDVGGVKRVLQTGLSKKDETLLLLYSSDGPVSEAELVTWVEHSNPSVYRRDILRKAHRARLVEYNEKNGTVELSPTGVAYVEEYLPLDLE